MSKIGPVVVVIVLVAIAYILLLVVMPLVAEIASTANVTMAASSNMSNYPGTQDTMLSAPWALFFVPGVVGIIAIVIILKRG